MTVSQDCPEKAIAAHEGFGFALELNLAVFIQVIDVFGNASVKDGVKLVSICAGNVQGNQVLNLLPAIHLLGIKIALQIVQLVGIGFTGLDRGAVVVLEGYLHRFSVVGEVQNKSIALLRMGAVQPGERLHGQHTRQRLVYVHRVQQRFIKTGNELVGNDQKAIRLLFELDRNVLARKIIQIGLGFFCAANFKIA